MASGIVFLLSQHPAINHALLLREIRELRGLGMDIHTASVRDADRPAGQLTADEQDELARTFYIKAVGLSGALRYHIPFALSHPVRYLRGLGAVLQWGHLSLKKTAALFSYFIEAVILGQWMQQRQLQYIHSQYSSTVGLLLHRMFPVRLSVSFHGPDEFTDPVGFWLREKIEVCHFVRGISFYACSQLMKSCESDQWAKIEKAYMGVDPSAFTARPFRAAPQPFELLCVGRLSPVKAQHILLAAVEQLQRQGRHVRLHLAGGGPDLRGLQQAVEQRGIQQSVTIHGWVSQEQLDGLYRQADAFVLASFAEGLPGVLMEAMAMEIPCISTWITGVPELIRDQVDGLLVPPSDPTAMATAVKQLMDDAGLRESIGKAGRLRIMDAFDLHKNAVHLHGIFLKYMV